MISSVICEVAEVDQAREVYQPRRDDNQNICQRVWNNLAVETRSINEVAVQGNISVLLSKTLSSLCPSFLSSRHTNTTPQSLQHNQIAVLDGLRGWACLFVLNEHLTYILTRTFLIGYGQHGQETFVQLPFIRIPWSGFSMVCIFYVISGYVLSYKPMKLMQAKRPGASQQAVTSSLVRRPLRLFPPVFIAVFITAVFIQLGAFEPGRRVWNTNDNVFDFNEPPPPYIDGVIAQMVNAAKRCTIMLYFWDWSVWRSAGEYDRHTWTIVVEFRTSMVLYLSLLATSRMTVRARINLLLGFMTYCYYTERREVLTFVAGALLAQIDLLRDTRDHPSKQNWWKEPTPNSGKRILFPFLCFITGLYLCSTPIYGAERTWGFQTLVNLVPEAYDGRADYIRTLGAIFVVFGAMNCEWTEKFFSNRISAYLGKISYALYLVHGPVLRSLLYAAIPTIYKWTGDGTLEGQTVTGVVKAWIISAILVGPVIFWFADLFWRFVDIPCVKLTRKIEAYLTDSSADDCIPPREERMKGRLVC